MPNKKPYTTESFIAAAKLIHGGKYDYSAVVYTKGNNPVKIICPVHGEFSITAKVFLSPSSGCPSCRRNRSYIYKDEFIEESKARYGDVFDYTLLPPRFMKTDKLTFICKKHGEFVQSALLHLNAKKHSCKRCMLAAHGTATGKRMPRVGHNLRYVPTIPDKILHEAKALVLPLWKPPR